MKASPRSRWNGEKALLQYERLPSPWQRFAARLIDQALTALLGGALLTIGLVYENDPLTLAGFAALFAGPAIYEIVCTARWGRTLGKKIYGLRVVSVSDGRPPTVIQAILRWLVLLVAFWAGWSVVLNRNHRGPHDRLSGTVVVYACNAPAVG